MIDAYSFEAHPLAAMFPLVEGEEYDNLVESIRVSGLQNPILVDQFKRQVIDGRNRLRACADAGVEPVIRLLPLGTPEWQVVEMILALNVHRRHLTVGQRADIASEPMIRAAFVAAADHRGNVARAEAAQSRRDPETGQLTAQSVQNSEPTGKDNSKLADAKIGEAFGISRESVAQARKVREAAEAGDENAQLARKNLQRGVSLNSVATELKAAQDAKTRAEEKAALSTEELDRQEEATWVSELRSILSNAVNDLDSHEVQVPDVLMYHTVEEVKIQFQELIDRADAKLASLQNELDKLVFEHPTQEV